MNHKDWAFNKSQRFAPVLSYSSLQILTSKFINKVRILQQGDFKNAFCNALLPDNKIAIARPPLGDPNSGPIDFWLLNKTLYGLRRLPRHWYNPIMKILRDMGLTPSNHSPSPLAGVINDGTPLSTPRHKIHMGLYVNDLVFFLESDSEESCLKRLINDKVTPDFMGDA